MSFSCLKTYFFCLSDSQDSGSLCFCFRWLLIWFKREFPFEDILTLWEVSAARLHMYTEYTGHK